MLVVAEKKPPPPPVDGEMLRGVLRPGAGWAGFEGRRHPGGRLRVAFAVDPPRTRTVSVNVPRLEIRGAGGIGEIRGGEHVLVRSLFPGIIYHHVQVDHQRDDGRARRVDTLCLYGWEGEFSFDVPIRYLNLPNGSVPVCFADSSVMRRQDPREAYWNTSFGNDDATADYEAITSGRQPVATVNVFADAGVLSALVHNETRRLGLAEYVGFKWEIVTRA